jgi:hypothetical protein
MEGNFRDVQILAQVSDRVQQNKVSIYAKDLGTFEFLFFHNTFQN